MSIDVAMAGAPPAAEEWISGLKARRCLRVSYGSLARRAILGKVRTRLEPGVAPRYAQDDVEAIAAQRKD
jgi:hypothetical protein